MNFYKECVSGDYLKKTTWSFMMFENMTFVLNGYTQQVKPSKRHKNYEVLVRYDRLSARDSNITENEVPIPEFILIGIREHVNNLLSVKKWSEYKNR